MPALPWCTDILWGQTHPSFYSCIFFCLCLPLSCRANGLQKPSGVRPWSIKCVFSETTALSQIFSKNLSGPHISTTKVFLILLMLIRFWILTNFFDTEVYYKDNALFSKTAKKMQSTKSKMLTFFVNFVVFKQKTIWLEKFFFRNLRQM